MAVIIGGIIIPAVLHPLNVTIFSSGKDILLHIVGALSGLFVGLISKKRGGMNIKKLILLTFLLSLFLFPSVYAHLDRGEDKTIDAYLIDFEFSPENPIVGHKVRLAFSLAYDTAKEVIESKSIWTRISSLQEIVFAGTSHSESNEHEITETPKEKSIKMTATGVKYIVDPKKIISGGPPKDGIPSIDEPKYVGAL